MYHTHLWERLPCARSEQPGTGERSHLKLKMVNNCCIVGCTNYVGKKPGLRFYSFPSDTAEREMGGYCAEKRLAT